MVVNDSTRKSTIIDGPVPESRALSVSRSPDQKASSYLRETELLSCIGIYFPILACELLDDLLSLSLHGLLRTDQLQLQHLDMNFAIPRVECNRFYARRGRARYSVSYNRDSRLAFHLPPMAAVSSFEILLFLLVFKRPTNVRHTVNTLNRQSIESPKRCR